MKKLTIAAIASLMAFTAVPLAPAQAQGLTIRLGDRDRDRCRVERVRTVRPNGRVVVRTERVCRPGRYVRRDDCRVRQVRTVRNGRVTYRTVRTCR